MSSRTAIRGGAPEPARRGAWTLDPGQAADVLAGARRALFVMAGVLAVIWLVQVANWADGYRLSQQYGIVPRDIASLPHLLTAPFLHFSWTHIEGNSGPLFIFGFLAAYRGIAKFAAVTVVAVLASGLADWFFAPAGTVGAGASGVVFGYFGYIIVRGLFDRRGIDVLIGAIMALCFAYQFSVLLPHQGIGWQAHVGGAAGGIVSGWLFRDRRARAPGPAQAARAAAPAARPGIPPASPGQGARPGGKLTVDPSHPRAELYRQLDEMGL